jgi:aminoglycoside phosphotransferase (APT) family kinase protein
MTRHRTIAGRGVLGLGVGGFLSTGACGMAASESLHASHSPADVHAACRGTITSFRTNTHERYVAPAGASVDPGNAWTDPGVLASSLHDLLPRARLGLPADFHLEGPISIRPQSVVYRLDHSGGAHSLAVKQYIDPSQGGYDSRAAIQQFGDLARSYAAMNGSSFFRIPEPICLFENEAIMLMEWVDGRPLLDALRRRWPFARSLTPLCRLAGAWLRAFHEGGSVHTPACGADGPDEQMARIRVAMERNEIVLPAASHGLNTLAEYLPAVRARPVVRTWLHGDFQPGNVIFTPKAVYGIDVIHSTYGIALADVAHFLNHVRRMAFQPSGLHLIASHRRILNAFISGYGGPHGDVDPLVLTWYRLLDDLRFLGRYYRDAKTAAHQWYFVRLQSVAISQHAAVLRDLSLRAAGEG